MTPEELFAGHPAAMAAFAWVKARVTGFGPHEVRVSATQIAFRRRRGFAYLWLPGRWVRTDVDVVLSVALDREIESPRFKEVAHPARTVWMHHFEVRSVEELDDEVATWLDEAYRRAA